MHKPLGLVKSILKGALRRMTNFATIAIYMEMTERVPYCCGEDKKGE